MTKLKYFSGAVFTLKCSFLYPIETKSRILKSLYFLWGFVYLASLVTTAIQCAIYLTKNQLNLIDESMVIMNTAIYFSIFINFSFLIIKRDKLYKLVEEINENFILETDNYIENLNMRTAVKISDYFAYYWATNCAVASLMPTISQLIGGNTVLPILEWIPYDYNASQLLYSVTYIWQVLSLANLGLMYAVSDLVFPCFSVLIAQQFKILGSNMKNCIYRVLLDSNLSKDEVTSFSQNLYYQNSDISKILETDEFQRNNLKYFKKHIQYHQKLLKYCQDINEILSTFLMGKISAAIFNTLFMAFSLITTGNQAMIVGLATYVMSTSTELFIYTYSGQILTQNADIMKTLYECPWYLCNLKFQKTFRIVQMRAAKIFYTKAGNYFTMSAPSFIMFMKALGSYVALLKELTDRRPQ